MTPPADTPATPSGRPPAGGTTTTYRAKSATGSTNGHGAPPASDPFAPPPPKPWYKRSTAIGAAALVVIAGAAVVADLPTHATTSDHIATVATDVKAINTNVHPCGFAVAQAFSFYRQVTGGQLSATDRARVPGYLRDDQTACSFTDQSVINLGTLTLPQTAAGRQLADVVKSVLTWETSDGVAAIDDIETLVTTPRDAQAKADLLKQERLLASDRAATDRAMQRVNAALGPTAHVRPPALPRLPTPAS